LDRLAQEAKMRTGARISLEGIVQGVGFRPFVHRLATSMDLSGWVLNSSSGVIIEVEGARERLERFYEELITSSLPAAKIIRNSIEFHPPLGLEKFQIRESLQKEGEFTPVSPDLAPCLNCYQELFAPYNRRYRYPFINCTDCGPRFTIIEDVPYDRARTTMKVFRMCPECDREYKDITNRRYHAEPNACSDCGPRVWLSKDRKEIPLSDPIREATKLLKEGYIVAVKGLGGFHLACNAEDDEAVKRLRDRKRREKEKPFAIMSCSLEKIRRYCEVNREEETLLFDPKRPIVLLEKREGSSIADAVAPNSKYLGVMLAYTPLHYLLLDDDEILALVMTSGNPSEEPLTKKNPEAEERLGVIADYFLMHNRDIYNRCDDSVTQMVGSREVIIRRSRGYAPAPIRLGFEMKQVLGVGAELKNAFCLTRGNLIFLSQHIGDLKNLETLEFFKEAIDRYLKLFRIEPEIIAHDLHPDYLSTRFAEEYCASLPPSCLLFPVQHHHAHIASALAENGVDEEVIGCALDGIGYGTDGHIWGGEFMVCDFSKFERVAHLKYVPMPGGDMVTKEPFRMTISYLYSVYKDEIPMQFWERWGEEKISSLLIMIREGINSPLTSSAGRLFDTVSSIMGIRDTIDYEAQAAIELEMIASRDEEGGYDFEVFKEEDNLVIDPSPVVIGVIQDLEKRIDISTISAKFHNTVVNFILYISQRIREERGIKKVVLSGGVFQNRYLLKKTEVRLLQEGFIPILHFRIPPNDGGISLGQAIIASRSIER